MKTDDCSPCTYVNVIHSPYFVHCSRNKEEGEGEDFKAKGDGLVVRLLVYLGIGYSTRRCLERHIGIH